MSIFSRFDAVTPYRTKDFSEIRELMHPDVHGNKRQSLAHASVLPGRSTLLHKHLQTEEVYHFLHGDGEMSLGEQRIKITKGDTVCIPAGTPHKITNTGRDTMQILCCCCPPYRHEDTELIESPG